MSEFYVKKKMKRFAFDSVEYFSRNSLKSANGTHTLVYF